MEPWEADDNLMNDKLVAQLADAQDHWNDLFSTKLIESLDRIASLEKELKKSHQRRSPRWALYLISVVAFLLACTSLIMTLRGLR